MIKNKNKTTLLLCYLFILQHKLILKFMFLLPRNLKAANQYQIDIKLVLIILIFIF